MKLNVLQKVIAGILVCAFVLLLTPLFLYTVDQREMAVVLRFGKPVRQKTEPGLSYKIPGLDNVRFMPSTKQFWGGRADNVMPDLPTKDDKKIEIVPWAVWRITDPEAFVTRLRTMEKAEARIAQIVRSAMRDVITQYDLAEFVRSTSRDMQMVRFETVVASTEGDNDSPATTNGPVVNTNQVPPSIRVGRNKILEEILAEARRNLESNLDASEGGSNRGIELLAVGISQIDFVNTVREKTFDRWIAEREAISSRNINEGEQLRQEILNRTNAEVERILGEGSQKSNETRGNVDAEIIRDYAQAIEQMGDFYEFVRTLEAYEESIKSDTRLILTTESGMFKLLKDSGVDASQ